MSVCSACGGSASVIYVEGSRRKCLPCMVDASRKRYWARKDRQQDPYGTVQAGPCFLCDGAARYGVLRELSRDGNSETCPTWICWPCHLSVPKGITLYDYETEPVAPLRGIDFPALEGVPLELRQGQEYKLEVAEDE